VVLDESPIDDIRNTRLIHAVVQRGTVVDREALRVRCGMVSDRLRVPIPHNQSRISNPNPPSTDRIASATP